MKIKLLSLLVTTGSYKKFIEDISMMALQNKGSYVCVANVHMLIEAHKDPNFAAVVNNADMATPDGMPLVWAIKKLYGVQQDRVAGMDLLPDLLQSAAQQKIAVYFYGTTTAILEKTEEYVTTNFPGLILAGCYSPPFRALTNKEEVDVIEKINSSGAKLVFVALGCPKQEKWMAAMKNSINACMVGIGAALPVMVGMQKRAPLWMQKSGLEWLYRLFQEPRRLAKRYFVTNSMFMWLLFKSWAKQGFSHKSVSEIASINN
jgi:N-acetylglucosaminyldiphosphoundecaprenol N-acetyl-beta-D-mannosaminyltransferase